MSHNYTYLDLVNGVLVRLREDTVLTVDGNDDVVVQIVKDFVNDAKNQIENMHPWTALSQEWSLDTTDGNAKPVLTNSHSSCIIEYIYKDGGDRLEQRPKEWIRRKNRLVTDTNEPQYWCIDGIDRATGDLRLEVHPSPDGAYSYTVYGSQPEPRLVNDTDVCYIPGLAVIYLATALAARERGEVGGQSAGELLGLAKQFISDAIAQDSTNSDLENIWTTV